MSEREPVTSGESTTAGGWLTGDVAHTVLCDLGDAVVVSDAEGRIVFWNDACERLFGWTSAEALGATLDLIIPERHRARHWEGYRGVVASGSTRYGDRVLEVPALHRAGRRLSVAFSVTLIRSAGAVVGVAAVVRDDTERWQERQRLRQRVQGL